MGDGVRATIDGEETIRMASVTIQEAQSTLTELIHRLQTGDELGTGRPEQTRSKCPRLPGRLRQRPAITDLGLTVLPITVEITDTQMTLPRHHRDPFDRLLVAQCLVESMPIVSADSVFDAYGVTRVWA